MNLLFTLILIIIVILVWIFLFELLKTCFSYFFQRFMRSSNLFEFFIRIIKSIFSCPVQKNIFFNFF